MWVFWDVFLKLNHYFLRKLRYLPRILERPLGFRPKLFEAEVFGHFVNQNVSSRRRISWRKKRKEQKKNKKKTHQQTKKTTHTLLMPKWVQDAEVGIGCTTRQGHAGCGPPHFNVNKI